IPNSICDGSGHWDHWRLSHSFSAERAKLRWHLYQERRDGRHILAMRKRIVHQCRGEQLSLLIISHTLQQRPAYSLDHTTVDLTFYLRGVNGTANILGRNIVEHTHLARLRINGDPRQVRSEHR